VYGGDGLARLPADEQGRGKAVFVPFVLPGEDVEVTLIEEKPGFARARLDRVVRASSQRTDPQCPYFLQCGGCHYQHTGYDNQLEIKASILKENLRRIAKLELKEELIIHASQPWNYRNRSRLKIRTQPQFSLGYFKFNSHELLPVEQCPISSPLINQAIAELWKWGRAGRATISAQEVEFFANAEDSELLIELYCPAGVSRDQAQSLSEEVGRLLPQIRGVVVFQAAPRSKTREEIEFTQAASSGAAEIVYLAGDGSYHVSAGSFFQVNRNLLVELMKVATGDASGNVAIDLYAGVGLFSSELARRFAQVIAVEASQTSHSDLVKNSPANVKAVLATTEEYLQRRVKTKPDLVIVDPPRSGLGSRVVKGLLELGAPRLIYVSCDPATLARDLVGLLSAGYRVEHAHLMDLFPQTFHMESIFHLAR